MFSESTTDLEDLAVNVLQEILSQHPGEEAITPRMIEEALDPVSNPKHFSRLSVKRSLIKTGHIAKNPTLRCRTTEKKNTGHRILKFPVPDDGVPFQALSGLRPYPDS